MVCSFCLKKISIIWIILNMYIQNYFLHYMFLKKENKFYFKHFYNKKWDVWDDTESCRETRFYLDPNRIYWAWFFFLKVGFRLESWIASSNSILWKPDQVQVRVKLWYPRLYKILIRILLTTLNKKKPNDTISRHVFW